MVKNDLNNPNFSVKFTQKNSKKIRDNYTNTMLLRLFNLINHNLWNSAKIEKNNMAVL